MILMLVKTSTSFHKSDEERDQLSQSFFLLSLLLLFCPQDFLFRMIEKEKEKEKLTFYLYL
jgi:hypothetical protein